MTAVTFNQSSLQSFSWMSSRCKKTYDRSPRRFSGAQRRSYTIREDSSIFFSVVTRWLQRRGQLLDDQWWQSIAEEAVRETFSQMEPNRAWSQNLSSLTCLDGLVCYVFHTFIRFDCTNKGHTLYYMSEYTLIGLSLWLNLKRNHWEETKQGR